MQDLHLAKHLVILNLSMEQWRSLFMPVPWSTLKLSPVAPDSAGHQPSAARSA
ncbi:hypothetical protein YSA_08671 [Pseudomonas putida ND6]|uniref:Uncharacterized protein n=1 Tax=Pseudomonas putida ND6 TaxID=231023 RepID=I3V140_PSEPU|nr:hypothetical protein YSA_08671 [Pseudomonas putida ND6]